MKHNEQTPPTIFGPETASWMRRLDPRAKMISNILYVLAVIYAELPMELLALLSINLLGMIIGKIPLRIYLRGLKPFIFLIVLTSLVQLSMTPGQLIWQYHFLHISREGMQQAGIISAQLFLIVLNVQLLLLSTSPVSLSDALGRLLQPLNLLRIPTAELVMIMTISLRFIPLLLTEAEDIKQAQVARGADFRSGNIKQRLQMQLALLVPLFSGALQRADELAQAMESRAYVPGEKRTRLHTLRMSIADYLYLTASLIVLIVLRGRSF